MELTNKSELFKPAMEKKKTDNAQNKTDDDNVQHADRKETKGFDTLMAEDIDNDDFNKKSNPLEPEKTKLPAKKKLIKKAKSGLVRPLRF